MRRRARTSLPLHVVFVAAALAACTRGEVPSATDDTTVASSDRLLVYSVSYPLAYFAERIGADQVRVEFPVPAGMDPASWSPPAGVVSDYQRADLILLNGAGYAKWVEHASLPRRALVDTSAAFRERYLPIEDAVTHKHGPDGEQETGDYAVTTWLDLRLAAEQARAVYAALARSLPQHEAGLGARFATLEDQLLALDRRFEAATRPFANRSLIFSRPVYQYARRRYRLAGQALAWEPDEAPSERMWQQLDALAHDGRAHTMSTMLWTAEPLVATAERLVRLGITPIVFDPAGTRPTSGDFLDVMRANAAALEAAGARAATQDE